MARPEPTYDLMLLLDTQASDEQRAKVLADAERIISTGGTITNAYDWGVRELAYEIRHKDDAEYRLIQFHAPAEVLRELDRALSIADGVMRHRIIKLAPGTPAAPDGGRAAEAEAEADASYA
jgi:small subunit ribosomal protein S6